MFRMWSVLLLMMCLVMIKNSLAFVLTYDTYRPLKSNSHLFYRLLNTIAFKIGRHFYIAIELILSGRVFFQQVLLLKKDKFASFAMC